MTAIAVFGAGGKIGRRISGKLTATEHDVRLVEIDPVARGAIASDGWTCMDPLDAMRGAEVVILAVPDTSIGALAEVLSPSMRPGTMVVVLDAAAPYSGRLPARSDLVYVVTHPCHPPLFPAGLAVEARGDHFGMVAPQDAVAALMQGPESAWAAAEDLVRVLWAPVMQVHRLSVEQIAILEPGLVEVTALTLLSAIREALDRVTAHGVPEAAARSFLLGHLHVELAMLFGYTDAELSDGAKAAVARSRARLLAPGWEEAVDPALVRRATDEIVGMA